MIMSTDTEKTLDKIQHTFTIKTLSKLEVEENSLSLIKGIYENRTANIVLSLQSRT